MYNPTQPWADRVEELSADGQPFFAREDVNAALEELAGGPLTVILGAGASAESGLPLWRGLLEQLLVHVGEELGIEQRYELAKRVRSAESTLGAATIARTVLGDEKFIPALRYALWKDVFVDVRPGATQYAVALLCQEYQRLGERLHLATLNYDLLLEKALNEQMGEGTAVAVVGSHAPPEGAKIAVRHLHGFLSDSDSQGIVLSESDYLLEPHDSWQWTWLRDRLIDSNVVFIGASVTDLDLLRSLLRHDGERRKVVAVIPREPVTGSQEDVWSGHDPLYLQAETLGRERWNALGVTPLHPDWYVQSAQFVFELVEIASRIPAGGGSISSDYRPYEERLARWFDDFRWMRLGIGRDPEADEGNEGGSGSAHSFRKRQKSASKVLRGFLRERLFPVFHEYGFDPSEETIVLRVWTRIPTSERRQLAETLCSDRRWMTPKAVDVRRITMPSRQTAVQAFCSGFETVRDTEGDDYQWNYTWAIPIRLGVEDWLRNEEYRFLPAGVVTLLSSLPLERSVMGRIEEDPQVLDSIRRAIGFLGLVLLDPLGRIPAERTSASPE